MLFTCSVESSTDDSLSSTKTTITDHRDDFPYKDGQEIIENGEKLTVSVSQEEEAEELQGEELEKARQDYLGSDSLGNQNNQQVGGVQKKVVWITIYFKSVTVWSSVTAFRKGKRVWRKKYIRKFKQRKVGDDGPWVTTFDTGRELKGYQKFSDDDGFNVEITEQPKPSSIFEGESFSLSASVIEEGETGTVTYQWLKNGQVVSSDLNYSVPSSAQSHEGVYQLKVKVKNKTLKSIKVGVIVVKKPTITLNDDNPFDINETIDDKSIKKTTKYKWIDAGGGNYDLEVSLKLDVDLSGGSSDGSSGSISKQIQLENGVDKDKYFEGVGVSRSITSDIRDLIGLYIIQKKIYKSNLKYQYIRSAEKWKLMDFTLHYFFGKGSSVDLKDVRLGNDFQSEFYKRGLGIANKKASIKKNIELGQTLYSGSWGSKTSKDGAKLFSSQIPIHLIGRQAQGTSYLDITLGSISTINGTFITDTQFKVWDGVWFALGFLNINVDWKVVSETAEYCDISVSHYFPWERFEDVKDFFNIDDKLSEFENGVAYDITYRWDELQQIRILK